MIGDYLDEFKSKISDDVVQGKKASALLGGVDAETI